MNGYYLVPHFEQMTQRDLLLAAFYGDRIVVSDGLVWWKFFDHRKPLLSYLTPYEQAGVIKDIAQGEPVLHDLLQTYADLTRESVIAHEWLASASWDLGLKTEDTPLVRDLVTAFNEEMKGRRSTAIVEGIFQARDQNPKISSADAIKSARQKVAAEVRAAVVGTFMGRRDWNDAAADVLRNRIAQHARNYLKAERYAYEWSLTNAAHDSPYAGYLADVIKDMRYNNNVVPVFASPEAGQLFQRLICGIDHGGTGAGKGDAGHLAAQVGLSTLAALPEVGFRGVDEMMVVRGKLGEELKAYSTRMKQVVQLCQLEGTHGEGRDVAGMVSYELLPAIRELSKRVDQCKSEVDKWLLPVAGVNAAGYVVGALCGMDWQTALQIAIPTMTSTVTLLASRRSREQKIREVERAPEYAGLSLILRLRTKR